MRLGRAVLAPADTIAIGRRALGAAGHEVQNALPSEAPSAPDLVPGNDPLLGQSIHGLHVDLEESGHLSRGDYFLQRPLTPSCTLNLPRAPECAFRARAVPADTIRRKW